MTSKTTNKFSPEGCTITRFRQFWITSGSTGRVENLPANGTGGLDISPIGDVVVFPAFSGTLKSFGKGTSPSDTSGNATLDTSTVLSDPTLAGFTNWGGG